MLDVAKRFTFLVHSHQLEHVPKINILLTQLQWIQVYLQHVTLCYIVKDEVIVQENPIQYTQYITIYIGCYHIQFAFLF